MKPRWSPFRRATHQGGSDEIPALKSASRRASSPASSRPKTRLSEHRREHEDVPVFETFELRHWATIGTTVGALLGSTAALLTGMAIGPFTLVAAGPIAVALEAAYAGGATGFVMGVLHGLTESTDEAEFHMQHIHDGVVWVGVHATGERAAKAREVLTQAGARHFM